jgi:hypothetical protein
MRLFNVDQHISVVADLKNVWRDLGHTIEDWCLSGHSFVFGRKDDRDKIPEMADDAWCAVSNGDRWWELAEKYRPIWDQYDGYVVTYPPVFARLFETYGKPIIVHIPIRFDYGVHDKPELLDKLIACLRQNNVYLCANNKFDKAYAEAFVGKEVRHIPSLCRYTGMRYNPTDPRILVQEHVHMAELDRNMFVNKHVALKAGYQWSEMAKFRAVAHFPYQISTMSIFEQYTAQIPLLFPTKDLMMRLWKEKRVLEHMTHYPLWRTAPGSQRAYAAGWEPPHDPNAYDNEESVSYWLDKADYYDSELMPDIMYFDSMQELHEIAASDMRPAHYDMLATNIMRRQLVYREWEKVFKEIACAS